MDVTAPFVLHELCPLLPPLALLRLEALCTATRLWCLQNDTLLWRPHCIERFDVSFVEEPLTFRQAFIDHLQRGLGRYAGLDEDAPCHNVYAPLTRAFKIISKANGPTTFVQDGFATEAALDEAVAAATQIHRRGLSVKMPLPLRCLYRITNGQRVGEGLISPFFGGHVVYGTGTFSMLPSLDFALKYARKNAETVEVPIVCALRGDMVHAWLQCSVDGGEEQSWTDRGTIRFGHISTGLVNGCPVDDNAKLPPLVRWIEEYANRVRDQFYSQQTIQASPHLSFKFIALFPRSTKSPAFSSYVTKGIKCTFGAVSIVHERRWGYHLELNLLSESEQEARQGAHVEEPFEPVKSAKLQRRQWIINGGTPFEESADGDGVIGLYPELQAGDPKPFSYESQTFLDDRVELNTMEGWLTFYRTDPGHAGEVIRVRVGRIHFQADPFVFAQGHVGRHM